MPRLASSIFLPGLRYFDQLEGVGHTGGKNVDTPAVGFAHEINDRIV